MGYCDRHDLQYRGPQCPDCQYGTDGLDLLAETESLLADNKDLQARAEKAEALVERMADMLHKLIDYAVFFDKESGMICCMNCDGELDIRYNRPFPHDDGCLTVAVRALLKELGRG